MEWRDHGIVLSARRHGEHAIVLSLLTRTQGRYAGLVRGGAGRRARGIYEPGNRVDALWRARLAEHLGAFTCEPVEAVSASVLDDPLRLAGLSAACVVFDTALAEREPHPHLYDDFLAFLAGLGEPEWAGGYVRLELGLLADLGFGLDLSRCAATGATEDLIYVSPRSGRAVSRSAGAPYAERLLALPEFLTSGRIAAPDEILAGLRLTGHFLETQVYGALDRPLPAARARFVDRLRRLATISRSKEE